MYVVHLCICTFHVFFLSCFFDVSAIFSKGLQTLALNISLDQTLFLVYVCMYGPQFMNMLIVH
jgi:hypothetical protein